MVIDISAIRCLFILGKHPLKNINLQDNYCYILGVVMLILCVMLYTSSTERLSNVRDMQAFPRRNTCSKSNHNIILRVRFYGFARYSKTYAIGIFLFKKLNYAIATESPREPMAWTIYLNKEWILHACIAIKRHTNNHVVERFFSSKIPIFKIHFLMVPSH